MDRLDRLGRMDRRDPARRDRDGAGRDRADRAGSRQAIVDLLSLLLPVECPGCGCVDVPICRTCLAPFTRGLERVEPPPPRLDRLDGRQILPVWSLTAYTGTVRGVIVAWKDRGRADLAPLLGLLLEGAVERLGPTLRAAGVSGDLSIVPMASSSAARRRRGGEPVRELAACVTDALRDYGLAARTVPAIVQRAGVRDQAGLSGRERGQNLERALRVRRSAADRLADGMCLLVDDVVTTGATLAAAERVLAGAGARPIGAVVLAATPSPRGS